MSKRFTHKNFPIKEKVKKYIFADLYKPYILCTVFLALIADIFLLVGNSDLRFFGISLLFLISAIFYRFSSKLTFILCLVLLGIMYVSFLISGPSALTEKVAVWLVLFMIVGIIQQWNE